MAPARVTASSDADIKKILAKLTDQVTKHVNSLYLLREEVAAVSQQQRTEESHLRDLLEERAKIVFEEKRAHADQGIASREYERKLSELENEMNKHREAAITSEVDEKVLATLRDLVAQKNNELAVLRRDKQWTPDIELFCAPVSVSSAIVSQITCDVKEASKKVEKSENALRRLHCKRIEADKIVDKIRAYTETEKNANLDMECRVNALSVERTKEKDAALIVSHPQQVRPIRLETAFSLEHSKSRSTILKEVEEEKNRGGNLTKEICEVMQLAAKYAAERQQWLKRQFSQTSL